MSWKIPETRDISLVIPAANERVLICSPFIKEFGISLVEDALPSSLGSIELWTRMDSRAWITGGADPEAVLDFLERHAGRRRVELYTSNMLHAKFIISDESLAAVGSGNLTRGGWSDNLEIVRLVQPPEISEVLSFVEATRPLMSATSLAEYRTFVDECQAHADEK